MEEMNDELPKGEMNRKERKHMSDLKITGIELFEYDIDRCFHFELGQLAKCRYGILKLSCEGVTGWGECIMSANNHRFDMIKWSKFLCGLRKLTIRAALEVAANNRLLFMRKPVTEMLGVEFVKLPQAVGIGSASRTSSAACTVKPEVCHPHPGSFGTFKETFQYAKQVRSQGVPLQIHKDYLIGPACSAWQLAAVSLDTTSE